MKFIRSTLAMTTAAIMFAAPAVSQNLTPEQQLDARTKVQTAVALAEIAEADTDGEAMLVAARMLSNLGRVAKRDRDNQSEPEFYSVADLAASAKSMGAAADRADQLVASEVTDRGICYWEYKCGTFECGWLYICE